MADNNQEENSPPKKGGNTLMIVLVAAIGVLGGGGWFVWSKFLSNPSKESEDTKKESPSKEKNAENGKEEDDKMITHLLDPVVINLRSINNQNRVLKVQVALRIINLANPDKIKTYNSILTDLIISFLREQSIKDIEGSGFERIRKELYERVCAAIPQFNIKNLLFLDFVTQ
jgi:flagellar basal body-associated protein FliL